MQPDELKHLPSHVLGKQVPLLARAKAHAANDEALRADGIRVVDLTPAAIGPFTVPPVNMQAHLDAPNVNMVTCGGQATIPIVAAVSQVAKQADMMAIRPRNAVRLRMKPGS